MDKLENYKYKIGQKVWLIRISKPQEGSRYILSYERKGVHIEQSKIIGVSDFKIVLETPFFETLDHDLKEQRRKSDGYYLNKTFCKIVANDNLFTNGMFVKRYSTTKPTKKMLSNMVAELNFEAKERYGFLFRDDQELYSIIDELDINTLTK